MRNRFFECSNSALFTYVAVVGTRGCPVKLAVSEASGLLLVLPNARIDVRSVKVILKNQAIFVTFNAENASRNICC